MGLYNDPLARGTGTVKSSLDLVRPILFVSPSQGGTRVSKVDNVYFGPCFYDFCLAT